MSYEYEFETVIWDNTNVAVGYDVTPGTHDFYTDHGWVQGDPPQVDLRSVVVLDDDPRFSGDPEVLGRIDLDLCEELVDQAYEHFDGLL